NDKWLINKEFYFTGSVYCHNSKERTNFPAWFVKRSGKEVEITEAECSETLICIISTRYNETCPSGAVCHPLLDYGGIRCPVEHRLSQLNGTKLTGEMEKLICDETKGLWTIEEQQDIEIYPGANIYCE
ncbi:hypothetical protein PENTCL1PPCAC_25191, partial [Pristionchus entomophagus]